MSTLGNYLGYETKEGLEASEEAANEVGLHATLAVADSIGVANILYWPSVANAISIWNLKNEKAAEEESLLKEWETEAGLVFASSKSRRSFYLAALKNKNIGIYSSKELQALPTDVLSLLYFCSLIQTTHNDTNFML